MLNHLHVTTAGADGEKSTRSGDGILRGRSSEKTLRRVFKRRVGRERRLTE